MTIGQYAAAGGVGVETVRYYQREGLLAMPAKGAGISRYGDADMRRLRFIRSAQRAGFTLGEIRELLALDAGNDRARARQLAKARVAKLDAQIVDLHRARDSLQRLARQCARGASGPCPILDAFER